MALGYHCDGPLVTLGVALNGADEYDGGGTVIAPLQERDLLERERKRGAAIALPAGHALVHPGGVRHAGAPIHSGARWLLVCHLEAAATGYGFKP